MGALPLFIYIPDGFDVGSLAAGLLRKGKNKESMQGKEQRLLSGGQNGKTFSPLLFLRAPSCFPLIQGLNSELLDLKKILGAWSDL